MTDLETSLHDEIGEVIGSYRPSDELAGRIGRRVDQRHRRVVVARAGAVLVTLLLLGGVFVASRSSSPSGTRVSAGPTRPPASAGSPPVTLPAVAHDPGAKPFDFNGYRVWVPKGWSANEIGTGDCSAIDIVPTDALPTEPYGVGPQCGRAPDGYRYLQLTPLVRPWLTTPHRVRINGYEAIGPTSDPGSPDVERFDVPALGVRIVASGPGARSILTTLGPSAASAFYAPRARTTAPRSWRTVTYGGIRMKVPADWPVDPGGSWCNNGIAAPSQVWQGATAGPVLCHADTRLSPAVDGVWIFPPTRGRPHDYGAFPPKLLRRGSVDVYLDDTLTRTGEYGYPVASLIVEFGDTEVLLRVGLGPDPSIAERIIDSIERA